MREDRFGLVGRITDAAFSNGILLHWKGFRHSPDGFALHGTIDGEYVSVFATFDSPVNFVYGPDDADAAIKLAASEIGA